MAVTVACRHAVFHFSSCVPVIPIHLSKDERRGSGVWPEIIH